MADLAKRQSTAIERVLSEIPDKSRARQNLRYARYKTQEHEKVELGAGTFGVALLFALVGFAFGTGGWGSVLTGVGAFFGILTLIFFWHWIHAPGAFRDHWESKAKELPDTAAQTRRKQFLAERLRDLLREAGEVDYGTADRTTADGMDTLFRHAAQHTRALHFVRAHYEAEIVKRFEDKGNSVLEELFAEALSDENPTPKPDVTYPKLEIEIKQTKFDFVDDHRIGTGNRSLPHEQCYVTLSLKIKNPRRTLIAIETFKLTLIVEHKEYVSFAESTVYGYRFVNLKGIDEGHDSQSKNLNEHPPLMLTDDKPVEGLLQFIFPELRYMTLLTDKTELQNSPFTLLLIDRDGERHLVEGTLTGEGHRYIN